MRYLCAAAMFLVAPLVAMRAPVQAAQTPGVHARIVDHGQDLLRDGDGRPQHQFGCLGAVLHKREDGTTDQAQEPLLDLNVDVDGDGRTDDDSAVYYLFSMEKPFSPVAPWYDTEATSSTFYGGAVLLVANQRDPHFSEEGVNHDHDGPCHWPRDNWALFREIYDLDCPYRGYALWLWKKADFLNGGAENRVSFDAQSEMALYLQRYWMGWEGCRWVVQDGDQFYISEQTFAGAGPDGSGQQHVLRPLQTRWAVYNPTAPYDIAFEPAGARFEQRQFDDVRAVGWYLFKDAFIPQYVGFKWYAFEVDAVVHRPERLSETLDMVSVPAGDNVPPFAIARTEVPYRTWKEVFRWARSNTFVRDPRGFIFDKDGDMGSMDYGSAPHGPDEPVTDVTLHDVAAWCNALSQRESRTPCYYEDPQLQRPFRFVKRSPLYRQKRPLPALYVRWDADGYRVPTAAEWTRAAAGQVPEEENAWLAANSNGSTHPVARRKPNALGLYDMMGNVWELVWPAGDAYDPARVQTLPVLGGGFQYAGAAGEASGNEFGDAPFSGSYAIGFRVVRREAGLARPPAGGRADVPTHVVRKGEMVGPAGAPAPTPRPVVETVPLPGMPVELARYETTFELWKQVRDWALAHGYSFDHDGDMGSMDYWGFGDWGVGLEHVPQEPVTDITVYDAAVWCNALSELSGRKPFYYADAGKTQPLRTAFEYRPLMMLFFEADQAREAGLIDYDRRKAVGKVYMDWQADGYRLPSREEHAAAMSGGAATTFYWGEDLRKATANAWFFDNSAGTTHPVGQKAPNQFGLYDVVGNVSEYANEFSRGVRLGGSFFSYAAGPRRGGSLTPPGWGYPDLGFRVARNVPAPAAGNGGARGPREATLLPGFDLSSTDPLKGKVYRGSLLRNGAYETAGVRELTGLKWRFETGGPVKSSPVVADGIVYFGSDDGYVYAVDAQDGRRLWRLKTGGRVAGSAALAGGTCYIVSDDGVMHAIDARTGRVHWQKRFSDGRPCGSPAVAYGLAFISGGNRGGVETVLMSTRPVVALDVGTGREVARYGPGSQGYGSPVIAGGRLYGGLNGSSFGATDLATGQMLWRAEVSGQTRQFSTAAIAEGVFYVTGTLGGDVAAYDAMTGRLRWHTFTREGQVALRYGGKPGYEVFTAPTVAYGRVYVGCNDGRLHTFDAATGARGWTFQAGDKVQSSPAAAGGAVYFGCHDGFLYAVDAQTGELLWKFATGSRIVSSPWPADGVVYVGSDDGSLYAVH